MGRFRVLGVLIINESCESKGLTERRFVRSCHLIDFCAGEILFSLDCEYENNKAKYSSC